MSISSAHRRSVIRRSSQRSARLPRRFRRPAATAQPLPLPQVPPTEVVPQPEESSETEDEETEVERDGRVEETEDDEEPEAVPRRKKRRRLSTRRPVGEDEVDVQPGAFGLGHGIHPRPSPGSNSRVVARERAFAWGREASGLVGNRVRGGGCPRVLHARILGNDH